MPNFVPDAEVPDAPLPNYQKKLRIKSALVSLLAKNREESTEESTTTSSSSPPIPAATNNVAGAENDTHMDPPSDDWYDPPLQPDSDDDSDDDDDDASYPSLQPPSDDEYSDDEDDILFSAAFENPDLRVEGDSRGSSSRPSNAVPTDVGLDEYLSSIEDDDDFHLDVAELAMLDLLVLCDASGARRGFYDNLLTLLRKHSKKGFVVLKAKGRKAFIDDMRKKVPTPQPRTTLVAGREVVHFSFLEMLQDLLLSSKFNDVDNLCVNREESERFGQFRPTTLEDISEIMSKGWAIETFESLEDFNPLTDFFLPLILYGDKTGTDVNQRYPLEPWMFTTAILRKAFREMSDLWRHLGFLPSLDDVGTEDGVPKESQDKVQLYHRFMEVLLQEVKDTVHNKPVMMVNLGGVKQRRRLHLHVSVVMGDQLSQDYLCGRKSVNQGNAGRVHRNCMTSGAQASNTTTDDAHLTGCRLVNHEVISKLNDLALTDLDVAVPGPAKTVNDTLPVNNAVCKREHKNALAFLKRRAKLAEGILAKTYSMFAFRNAFEGVPFGANRLGIVGATVDDHLHSAEAGIIYNLDEVSYGGLSPSELSEFEHIIRTKVKGCRSSALSKYPRAPTKRNFGKLTLSSHKEKVGYMYHLSLALHDKRGRELFEKAHKRQQGKYNIFPSKKKIKEWQKDCNQGKGKKRKQNVVPSAASDSADDDTDDDDQSMEDEYGDNGELPAASFPYRKDLLMGTDYQDRLPFDRTDESIEFVCLHLRRHGLGFLLAEDLDEHQLDLFMISAWGTLRTLKGKPNQYPSRATVEMLSTQDETAEIFSTVLGNDAAGTAEPSFVELTAKTRLSRPLPSRDIDPTASADASHQPVKYQYSLPISGCLPKHRRKRPKMKGLGFTGAVLSDTETFAAYVEYMLCYHAWCHYSHLLPRELQEDYELIDFASRMIVQYFDTILYRGDDSIDSDSGKIHTQLHNKWLHEYFGDLMQYNTSMGERGLKAWAKAISQTALKHGRDKFTHSTSMRIGEKMLLDTITDRLRAQAEREEAANVPPAGVVTKRRMPHFRYQRVGTSNDLKAVDRKGRERSPDSRSGTIQRQILEGIYDVELGSGNTQEIFDIWCESRLPSGEYIRCWPEYRGNQGPWYDWVMVSFEADSADEGEEGEEPPMLYPAKVLALYESCTLDLDGNIISQMKVLVHSVEFKTPTAVEGPFGDSRLATHYRLQFNQSNGKPVMYSLPIESIVHVAVAYEKILYPEPLVPPVRSPAQRKEHTVMTMLPRNEWGRVFLEWSAELKERHETESGPDKYRLDW